MLGCAILWRTQEGPRNTESKGHESNKGIYVGVLGEQALEKREGTLLNQHCNCHVSKVIYPVNFRNDKLRSEKNMIW